MSYQPVPNTPAGYQQTPGVYTPPTGAPQQPYAPQPYTPQPYSPQPYTPQPYTSQSVATPQGVPVQQYGQPQHTTVVVDEFDRCPHCQVGYMNQEFTCCGIVCAILFFPIGLLCCLLMKEHRCGSCGYVRPS